MPGVLSVVLILTLWSALRARGEFAGLVVRIVYGMLEGVRIVKGAITR